MEEMPKGSEIEVCFKDKTVENKKGKYLGCSIFGTTTTIILDCSGIFSSSKLYIPMDSILYIIKK